MPNYETLRKAMVAKQLISAGIRSDAVLDAMGSIPRHLFVPENLRHLAYQDSPLPIGFGQTISQPYMVAYMTEQLELAPGAKVLEIGAGSGYQAAILGYLGCEVYTIELLEELADEARQTLACLNLDNVRVKWGNGYEGWPKEAPFDAIIVTAAPGHVPNNLVEQLGPGGKMIIPVGQTHSVQILKLITKADKGIREESLLPVRFVPMVEVSEN